MENKNTGKTFEKAIEEVFKLMYSNHPGGATIEHNVFIQGPDGKRQFDVVITLKVPDGNIITVIEGKDYNSKISIQKIDEFHSKMRDVNANKGILVAKMGFSSRAISKAKRLGIVLYSLNDHSKFNEFDLQVPILIEEISPEFLNLDYSIERDKAIHFIDNIYFDTLPVINGINITEIINESWKNGSLKFDLIPNEQEIDIPTVNSPFFLKYYKDKTSNDTGEIELSIVKLRIKLKYKYYSCDIREIMHQKALKNIDKNQLTFFVDTNSISENLKNLQPITANSAKEFTGIQYVFRIRNNVNVEFYDMGFIPPK